MKGGHTVGVVTSCVVTQPDEVQQTVLPNDATQSIIERLNESNPSIGGTGVERVEKAGHPDGPVAGARGNQALLHL